MPKRTCSLEDKILHAERGKKIWDDLSGSVRADRYILMPHLNSEYNMYAFRHLPELVKKFSIKKLLILHLPEEDTLNVPHINDTEIIVKKLSEEEMDSLVLLYGLYRFSEKVVIVSLTKPYDTGAERFLGVHGTTTEDLLRYDIFNIDDMTVSE